MWIWKVSRHTSILVLILVLFFSFKSHYQLPFLLVSVPEVSGWLAISQPSSPDGFLGGTQIDPAPTLPETLATAVMPMLCPGWVSSHGITCNWFVLFLSSSQLTNHPAGSFSLDIWCSFGSTQVFWSQYRKAWVLKELVTLHTSLASWVFGRFFNSHWLWI